MQCEHLHLLLSLQQLYVAGKHGEGTVAVYALFCVKLTLKSCITHGILFNNYQILLSGMVCLIYFDQRLGAAHFNAVQNLFSVFFTRFHKILK